MPSNINLWRKLEQDGTIMYFSLITSDEELPEHYDSDDYPELKHGPPSFIRNYGIMILLYKMV